jgi:hypothetical protein
VLRQPGRPLAAGLVVGLSLVIAVILSAPPAVAGAEGDVPPSSGGPSGPGPSVDPSASDGQVTVTVSGTGSTVEGATFNTSRTQRVARVCWYGPDRTGLGYYEYWGPGGVARQSGTLDAYAYQGLLYPGYDVEPVMSDTTGRWYGPECRSDAPTDYVAEYRAAHRPVYWWPEDRVPIAREDVDPRVLAQIAYEFTDLPTGTVGWAPRVGSVGATVVNLDTWVWVSGAPTTVSVTASIPGTWARVDAVLDRVELSAPGAAPVTCADPGVAWTAGATTSCAIHFTRSSANQPVKAGQSVPTSTLTVTAVWTASWVSSVNSTPTGLPTQEITTITEIPVAEIQSVVTQG